MANRLRSDMEKRLQSIEVKIDALDQKIEATARALDQKIEATARALDQKIDVLAARVDAQVDRLDAKIDVQVEAVRDDIQKVAEGVLALGERVDRGFATMSADMRADREFFKRLFVNHEHRISALEQRPS